MNLTAGTILVAVLAYLAGSIPFGYLISRRVLKDDIRQRGSGNIGATNVARVVGKKWGALVLALDCLKGLLTTLLLPRLVTGPETLQFEQLQVICGCLAVLGHMFPVWLGFLGGKGVATGLGVILILSWQAAAIALVAFAIVFAATRMTSAASLTAAVAFCAAEFWLLQPDPFGEEHRALAIFAIFVPLLVVVRHRSNIIRLLQGREARFGDAP